MAQPPPILHLPAELLREVCRALLTDTVWNRAAVVDLCNLARTCRHFAVHVRRVLLHDPSEVFELHESVTGRYNLLRMALAGEVDLGTFTHGLAHLHDAAVQVERAYGGDDSKMLWAFTALLLHACKPLVDVDIWPDPLFEWPTALEGEDYSGLRALQISPTSPWGFPSATSGIDRWAFLASLPLPQLRHLQRLTLIGYDFDGPPHVPTIAVPPQLKLFNCTSPYWPFAYALAASSVTSLYVDTQLSWGPPTAEPAEWEAFVHGPTCSLGRHALQRLTVRCSNVSPSVIRALVSAAPNLVTLDCANSVQAWRSSPAEREQDDRSLAAALSGLARLRFVEFGVLHHPATSAYVEATAAALLAVEVDFRFTVGAAYSGWPGDLW